MADIPFACPNCADRPVLVPDGDYLVCGQCGRNYPVVNGIPHLLPSSGLTQTEREDRDRNNEHGE